MAIQKRKFIKQIGKQGKINILANKKIKEMIDNERIVECELKFKGCLGNWTLSPAHKEKRWWYKDKPELLWNRSQVLIACSNCHQILDDRSKTTKEKSDSYFIRKT